MRTTDLVIQAIRIPEPAPSRWHRAGISTRSERIFDAGLGLMVALFATGWTWSIAHARVAEDGTGEGVTSSTAAISSALTDLNSPTAAFLTGAAMESLMPLRGTSGRLRVRFQEPGAPLPLDTLPHGAELEFSALGPDGQPLPSASTAGTLASASTDAQAAATAGVLATGGGPVTAPATAGVWRMAIKAGALIKPITDFNVITLRPFTDKQRGRIGLYFLGSWPGEQRRRVPSRYRPPSGFIEVTRANQSTYVSDHFRLRDFLTKNQPNVWPKYLVLDAKLLDKLELVLAELAARGHNTDSVRVLSGFRTPSYNAGGGDPRGRAELSRHMYGDAADIYLDFDGNGRMDDLNKDRRVNIRDARVIEQAVNAVERAHPALLGGTGVYPGTGAHGPFVHIDTRGWRARWVGTRDSQ